MLLLPELIKITAAIRAHHYAQAEVIFLAGSLVRGEGTPHSDLDLVVIYASLPSAYRTSFYHQNIPVEAFVHDPETLNYFLCEVDRPTGVPSLAQMVSEGVEIPGPNKLSQVLKELAQTQLELGPPPLSEEAERKLRYTITNLIDDIRQPRSHEELVASGAELYGVLADYFLRSRGCWSARNKTIPRLLRQSDPALFARFSVSFDKLFRDGQSAEVITLAEEMLAAQGGFLFDGLRLEAPTAWRKPIA